MRFFFPVHKRAVFGIERMLFRIDSGLRNKSYGAHYIYYETRVMQYQSQDGKTGASPHLHGGKKVHTIQKTALAEKT